MFLYIVRHAWAGDFGDPRWPDDFQRPLTDEGIERFQRFAKQLARAGVEPQKIATSPLVRCRQTADLLSQAVDGEPPVEEVVALAPRSDLEALVEWSQAMDEQDNVAWVGHAPDVGHLAAALIGDGRANVRFAKGACCAIRFYGHIEPGAGELYWHVTAKVLGC